MRHPEDMAEAVLAPLAIAASISLLKGLVSSLLSDVVKQSVSTVWAGNKDYERLRGMLSRLEPVVSSISPTRGDASTNAWLEALRERLEAIKKVLEANLWIQHACEGDSETHQSLRRSQCRESPIFAHNERRGFRHARDYEGDQRAAL